MQYKIPLTLTPQPEGGYTVTSPLLPELITEGDTAEEALENVKDALWQWPRFTTISAGHLPASTQIIDLSIPLSFETVVGAMKYREVARKLTTLGCTELPRKGGGSHRKWHNPATEQATVVPDLGRPRLETGHRPRVVRQLGLDWHDFSTRELTPPPAAQSLRPRPRSSRATARASRGRGS